MKRILYIILVATIFAACSSDDDKDDDIIYIDNKIIEGKWYWIQATDSTVYLFDNNSAKKLRYEKYTGNLEQTIEYGSYKISSDKIYYPKYPKDEGREYKLKENTLSILESGDIWVDYTRLKE